MTDVWTGTLTTDSWGSTVTEEVWESNDYPGTTFTTQVVVSGAVTVEAGGTTTGAWEFARRSPSVIETSSTEIVNVADMAAMGLWLDGTGGRIEAPDGTTYLFSCDIDSFDLIRTTVVADVIDGDPLTVTPSGVPVGASAIGGKVYYDESNDQLVMVTHTNRLGTNGGLWSSVGFLRSTDWGESWAWVDDAITPNIDQTDPRGVGPNTIGSFSSYVVVDGFFYVFHSDQLESGAILRHCVSRADLSDLMDEIAGAGDLSTMFGKWNGSTWTQPGIGGIPANVVGFDPLQWGAVDHLEVLHVPSIGVYVGFIANVTNGRTNTSHLVTTATSPQGPWSTPVNPRLGTVVGQHIYATTFGSDGTRPWELQDDGVVQAYHLVQPNGDAESTADQWEDATVDLVAYAPYLALPGEASAEVIGTLALAAVDAVVTGTASAVDVHGLGLGVTDPLNAASNLTAAGGYSFVFDAPSSGFVAGARWALPAAPVPGAVLVGANVRGITVDNSGPTDDVEINAGLVNTTAGLDPEAGTANYDASTWSVVAKSAVVNAATADENPADLELRYLTPRDPDDFTAGMNLVVLVLAVGGSPVLPATITVDSIEWVWRTTATVLVDAILNAGGGGGASLSNDDPEDVGTTPSAGVATTASRSDHIHDVATNTANGLVRLDGSATIPDILIPASIARDTEVSAAVAALVASSPSTLDTLDELAAALGDDPNFATTIATSIGTKVAKSLYDANTILYATTDDTPVALTVGASTVVGRKASGDIVALTASELRTILGLVWVTAYNADVNVSSGSPQSVTIPSTARAIRARFVGRSGRSSGGASDTLVIRFNNDSTSTAYSTNGGAVAAQLSGTMLAASQTNTDRSGVVDIDVGCGQSATSGVTFRYGYTSSTTSVSSGGSLHGQYEGTKTTPITSMQFSAGNGNLIGRLLVEYME